MSDIVERYNWTCELLHLVRKIRSVAVLMKRLTREDLVMSDKFACDLGELFNGFATELEFITTMREVAPSDFHYKHAKTLRRMHEELVATGIYQELIKMSKGDENREND